MEQTKNSTTPIILKVSSVILATFFGFFFFIKEHYQQQLIDPTVLFQYNWYVLSPFLVIFPFILTMHLIEKEKIDKKDKEKVYDLNWIFALLMVVFLIQTSNYDIMLKDDKNYANKTMMTAILTSQDPAIIALAKTLKSADTPYSYHDLVVMYQRAAYLTKKETNAKEQAELIINFKQQEK